jgi:hypothetical protein
MENVYKKKLIEKYPEFLDYLNRAFTNGFDLDKILDDLENGKAEVFKNENKDEVLEPIEEEQKNKDLNLKRFFCLSFNSRDKDGVKTYFLPIRIIGKMKKLENVTIIEPVHITYFFNILDGYRLKGYITNFKIYEGVRGRFFKVHTNEIFKFLAKIHKDYFLKDSKNQ